MEKIFKLKENGTNVKTEILAGLTTFMTMAYIIALNPNLLTGFDVGSQLWNGVFLATCIASAVAMFFMAFLANKPFALAPGMGLNSFFAFSVVLGLGVSWQNALACVFTSGCIFMLLSVFQVQQKIVDAVPDCVKKSIGAGVGLFIAFSGFQSAGIVAKSDSTLVTIGQLGTPGTILALIGLVVTLILVIRGVKGGILIGIVLVTIAGLFVKDPATGMAYTVLPSSFIALDNPVEALAPTFGKLTFRGMFDGDFSHIANMVFCIISFLFVDLFDSIGVFLGVAPKAGLVDEQGKTPGAGKALFISAGAAAIGAIFGTSTVTIYGAESGAGIAAGGRTGLTACTIGALFLLTLIADIFKSSCFLFYGFIISSSRSLFCDFITCRR